MKYALISHYTPALSDLLRKGNSAYHMMLGQHFVNSGNGYRMLYEMLHAYGHFIMVDNGAHEGEQGDFLELAAAVRHIADEIVLPDTLFDTRDTIAKCMDPRVHRAVPAYQRCVVPQGHTVEEWCDCLDYFVSALTFRTIGVPKHLDRWENGRARAIDHLFRKGYHLTHTVHLFGVYRDPRYEISQLRAIAASYNGRIRGIDSACAVAYAQNGELLTSPEHYSMRWGVDFDLALAEENMRLMRMWCNEGGSDRSDSPNATAERHGPGDARSVPAQA